MKINMIYELFSDIRVLLFLITISLSLLTLMIVYRHKKTIESLNQALTEGDQKIQEEFRKIDNVLTIAEREINHMVNISKNKDEQKLTNVEQNSAALISTPLFPHRVIPVETITTGAIPVETVTPIIYSSKRAKYKKHVKSFKPLSKKFQKFLTPSGRIKKHYRDNPIAQECYQKFHGIKSSQV